MDSPLIATGTPAAPAAAGAAAPFLSVKAASVAPVATSVGKVPFLSVSAPTSATAPTKAPFLSVNGTSTPTVTPSLGQKLLSFGTRAAQLGGEALTGAISGVGNLISSLQSFSKPLTVGNDALQIDSPISKQVESALDATPQKENIGDQIQAFGDTLDEHISPENKNYLDKVAGGLGSAIPYVAGAVASEGLGVPALITSLGLGGVQALSSAKSDYDQMVASGDKNADGKAAGVFAVDLALNTAAHYLGPLAQGGASGILSSVGRVLKSTLLETGNYGVAQPIVSNVVQGNPPLKGVLDQALVMLPISAAFGAAGEGNNLRSQTTKTENILHGLAANGVSEKDAGTVLSGLTGVPADQVTARITKMIAANPELKSNFAKNELTPENVAQKYTEKVIAPAKLGNQSVILGSDNIKDINNKDYLSENHPVYSQATKDLFNKEVPQNPNPVVRLTAGGPGSGKTDFLIPEISKDFNGVIYDSTLSNYKTLQDRLSTIKEAGKSAEIYGIIPDVAASRHFADLRGKETGREVPADYFNKAHEGVIDTLHKALVNGDLTAEQVHLIDTRNLNSADDIRTLVDNGGYVSDPLATLSEIVHNRGNGRQTDNSVRSESVLPSREVRQDQGKANEQGGSRKILSEESTAKSKIGKSIEQKAVESKLTEGFSQTAGYTPVTIKDQAERATALINEDITKARAVVRGEQPLPEGLKGTALITAMEEYVKEHPDAELAGELANSPLVSKTSEAAQEMRLAAERTPDNATLKLQQMKEARVENAGGEKKVANRKREALSEAQKVERDAAKAAQKEKDKWDKFLTGITC